MNAVLSDSAQTAWLIRRAGFGASAAEFDEALARGPATTLDRLVEPDRAQVAASPDPFAEIERPEPGDNKAILESGVQFTQRWIDHLVATPRPLEEMMTWFWHDHFAVQLSTVRSGRVMADHINLLRKHALGNFRSLIRDVTVDAAMLLYLDGAKSTAQAPNENYGRELLELYTMGIGNYTEADVRAAAVALTGWQVRPAVNEGRPNFVARLHDARPQTMLGRSVSDVDSVVNAAVEHPATAQFIATKIGAWFLGRPPEAALVRQLSAILRDGGFELRPLVRAVLQAALDGQAQPVVLSPLAWWIALRRTTGAAPDARQATRLLEAAGQLPGEPPNVGGWPGMTAWLSASSTAARLSLATLAADSLAPANSALTAAAKADVRELARLLGLRSGFQPATAAALAQIGNCGRRPGAAALALAAASPDLLVA